MKFLIFTIFVVFFPSWIRMRIHWPDWIRIRIRNSEKGSDFWLQCS